MAKRATIASAQEQYMFQAKDIAKHKEMEELRRAEKSLTPRKLSEWKSVCWKRGNRRPAQDVRQRRKGDLLSDKMQNTSP